MQTCPNCSYENRPGVVFCENCGTSLIGSSAGIETRMIDDAELAENPPKPPAPRVQSNADGTATATRDGEPAEAGTTEFPENGMLRLEISETPDNIVMAVEKSVTFGRRDATTGSMPDIDLTPYAGYRAGVSRRHAEIRLDSEKRELNIWDLGSSNGTFLNGDRLISHRPYTISDGDSIRFGQLDVRVRFEHKAKEVKETKEAKEVKETKSEPGTQSDKVND